MKKLLTLISAGVLFSGCGEALGPNYTKPLNTEKIDSQIITNNEINTTMVAWWKEYNNNDLNSLIENAFNSNKDASILTKQLELVLNAAEISRLSFNPTGSISETITKSNNAGTISTSHTLGVRLSEFEFDYLGKFQKTVEINNALISTAKENLALFYSTLSFEIASVYSNIIYYDQKLEIQKNKLLLLKNMESIRKERFHNGIDDKSALIDIQSKITEEEQNQNSTEVARDNYLKTLKILIGEEKKFTFDAKINPTGIAKQINSKQLENRFDIRIAEQNLINKNARISIVKTLYYPSLSVNAFAGLNGSDSTAFTSMNQSFSITPSIMWNIFDIPKIGKLVKESEIQKEQALETYIKTVRNAFIEVKSNYDVYEKSKINLNYSKSYVNLFDNKLSILNAKFDTGMINKIQLLDVKYSYLDAQDALNSNNNNLFQQEIILKKSIGGKVKE